MLFASQAVLIVHAWAKSSHNAFVVSPVHKVRRPRLCRAAVADVFLRCFTCSKSRSPCLRLSVAARSAGRVPFLSRSSRAASHITTHLFALWPKHSQAIHDDQSNGQKSAPNLQFPKPIRLTAPAAPGAVIERIQYRQFDLLLAAHSGDHPLCYLSCDVHGVALNRRLTAIRQGSVSPRDAASSENDS